MLQFGVSLSPVVQALSEHVELAQAGESVRLDLVGIMDHPYQPRYHDGLALIGVLLARATRIRLGAQESRRLAPFGSICCGAGPSGRDGPGDGASPPDTR